MAEETQTPAPTHFTLSRHELLVILDALDGAIIPGLSSDPLGELSPEQEELARIIAQRALLARGFMRMQEDGPALHRWIVDALASCAFAPTVLMAIRREPEGAPLQFYAHFGGNGIVSHIPSPNALHAFAVLPSITLLLEQIDAITKLPEEGTGDVVSFRIPDSIFTQISRMIEAGNKESARALLKDDGLDTGLMEAFLDTFANFQFLTVFRWVQINDAASAEEKDFTVLHDGRRSWLLQAQDDHILVKSTSRSQFNGLLNELFDQIV